MSMIDRRTLIGGLACGAAVAAIGAVAMPKTGFAAPLGALKEGVSRPESLVEDAQVVVVVPRRRRRRWRCWWHRGRRICGWR